MFSFCIFSCLSVTSLFIQVVEDFVLLSTKRWTVTLNKDVMGKKRKVKEKVTLKATALSDVDRCNVTAKRSFLVHLLFVFCLSVYLFVLSDYKHLPYNER